MTINRWPSHLSRACPRINTRLTPRPPPLPPRKNEIRIDAVCVLADPPPTHTHTKYIFWEFSKAFSSRIILVFFFFFVLYRFILARVWRKLLTAYIKFSLDITTREPINKHPAVVRLWGHKFYEWITTVWPTDQLPDIRLNVTDVLVRAERCPVNGTHVINVRKPAWPVVSWSPRDSNTCYSHARTAFNVSWHTNRPQTVMNTTTNLQQILTV